MYRVNEESVEFLPRIPAQPIGYDEAKVLLEWIQTILNKFDS